MSKARFVGSLMAGTAAAAVALAGSVAHASVASSGGTAAARGVSASDDALLHRQATSDAELREQIALQLKVAPGGRQTSRNEVSYNSGKFVVTYALPGQSVLAAPDCPSGWFCFYDGATFGYPRGKLSDCGWQDLDDYGWSDRTSSVHNRTGNKVDYINHRDYGNPANGHRYDYVLFTNNAGQSISGLGGDNNLADHVNRRC